MTNDKKHATTELLNRLFNLSCQLDELSNRAQLLEDKIGEVRYALVDIVEEQEETK